MDKRFIPAVVAAAQAGRSAYAVPASVTLAQWALESAFGTHMPLGSNNPFGIKAKAGESSVDAMTWEVEHGVRVNKTQRFRKFDTLAAAFEAHARLLATSHFYTRAMMLVAKPDAFAKALTGVYATDPAYGSKLIAIMKANNLYAFDSDIPVSAAPAAAKPPAPVAAAPVLSAATKKASTMSDTAKSALAAAHPNTAALLPGVDFRQGAKDFATGVIKNLEAGAAAISNVKIPGVTDTSGFGTLNDLQAAAAKIKEIKSDFDKKDVQEGIADSVDFFKLTMAALDRYSIPYVKLVDGLAKMIPDLHSGGVNKAA